MGYDRGADLIIGPFPRPLDQQAPPFVLDQAVGVRPPSLTVDIDPVDPGSPPRLAVVVGPLEGNVRWAIPGQIVQINRAASILLAADLQANLGDGGATGILNRPGEVVA